MSRRRLRRKNLQPHTLQKSPILLAFSPIRKRTVSKKTDDTSSFTAQFVFLKLTLTIRVRFHLRDLMTKLAYLSSTALCALALVAGASPAAADDTDLFGSARFAFDWTNYEPESSSEFDTNTFIAQGTVGVPLGSGWSGQLNYSFETQDFSDFGLPVDLAIDTWQMGGVIAYQEDRWKFGLDMAYQALDFGMSVDGYRVGLRGEHYWSPNFTVRLGGGWQDYDNSGFQADGFYAGGSASYYFNDNVALRGSADYYEYDVNFGPISFGDYEVWDFGGKLQYKCDDYPVVFGAHVNYAEIEAFGDENDAWNFGFDITALFGEDASKSSLHDAERDGTFDPQRSGIKYFSF
jgi:hypothetical protein